MTMDSECKPNYRTRTGIKVQLTQTGDNPWNLRIGRANYGLHHDLIDALFERLPPPIMVEFDLELARRLADCFVAATPFRAMIDARIAAALKKNE